MELGGNQGVWGTKVPQWGPGAKPGRGSRGRSSPEAGAFLKSTQPEI